MWRPPPERLFLHDAEALITTERIELVQRGRHPVCYPTAHVMRVHLAVENHALFGLVGVLILGMLGACFYTGGQPLAGWIFFGGAALALVIVALMRRRYGVVLYLPGSAVCPYRGFDRSRVEALVGAVTAAIMARRYAGG